MSISYYTNAYLSYEQSSCILHILVYRIINYKVQRILCQQNEWDQVKWYDVSIHPTLFRRILLFLHVQWNNINIEKCTAYISFETSTYDNLAAMFYTRNVYCTFSTFYCIYCNVIISYIYFSLRMNNFYLVSFVHFIFIYNMKPNCTFFYLHTKCYCNAVMYLYSLTNLTTIHNHQLTK
jgi:hypothetical protein